MRSEQLPLNEETITQMCLVSTVFFYGKPLFGSAVDLKFIDFLKSSVLKPFGGIHLKVNTKSTTVVNQPNDLCLAFLNLLGMLLFFILANLRFLLT